MKRTEGEDPTESYDKPVKFSRRDALKTTAAAGAAAAGILGSGSAISALAASKDTKGKGQFTGWAGVSQGEVNVLKRLVGDPQFRLAFEKNPRAAIKSSGEKLTPAQVNNLSRANKLQVENFVKNVAGAAGTADGTHTLLYAIVLVLLLAVQGQEGAASAGGAVPVA